MNSQRGASGVRTEQSPISASDDRDETHESLWVATTEGPTFPALSEPAYAEVAVLGAGIAGVTTALLLKKAGLRVALIEASDVCRGATGHTTAKITSQHGAIYAALTSKHGEENARMYGAANQEGLELIGELVREHAIDCDFEQRPAHVYTDEDSSVSQLEKEAEAADAAGLPAHFTEKTDLPWQVKAAVRFDHQAQFHPRRYCLALARLVDGDGSVVFEQTRALDVEEGAPCVVKTDHGEVRAEHVVVATHLPFLDRGGFFARAHPEFEYAIAAKLSEAAPHGMYVSADQPTRSVRQHPGVQEDLIVVAGDSHKTGQGDPEEDHYANLRSFARRFPVSSFEYRWATQDFMPVDRLPYIGKLRRGSDRLYVATGFQKWGMTSGTFAGILIRDQIVGRENPTSALFDPNRVRPLAGSKQFFKANAGVARRFLADRLKKRSRSVEEIGPGEGKVVSLGGKQIAASRDDEGNLSAVSARCTHLGCIVAWNGPERTWDCPCHGSRFAPDGQVLEAPAVEPLEDLTSEVRRP